MNLARILAEIHVTEAPEDLLSRVGKIFLGEYIYPSFLNDNLVVLVTTTHENHVTGFALATLSLKASIRKLFFSHPLKSIRIACTEILTKPSLWPSLLASLQVTPPPNGTGAEIFMIAVSKNYQNTGLGFKLLSSLEKELANRKVPHCIARVRKENIPALKMYQKAGYQNRGEVRFNHANWCWMVKSLL